jgi:signal transduction histidine kinase
MRCWQLLSVLIRVGGGSRFSGSNQQQNSAPKAGQVEDLQRQLAEARDDKTRIFALLHEMRSPLNIMVGYAELILDNGFGETTGEMRDALDKIKRGGSRMAELINAAFEIELSKRRKTGGVAE